MELFIKSISESDAQTIVMWRYEPPYDVYNFIDDTVNHEELQAEAQYFLEPTVNCHVIKNMHGEMLGYVTFGVDGQVPGGDYSADALDIGMGIRPDLTGQGQGHTFINLALDFAIKTYHPTMLRSTIATFNTRAQRLCLRAGFEIVDEFVSTTTVKKPFYILTKKL